MHKNWSILCFYVLDDDLSSSNQISANFHQEFLENKAEIKRLKEEANVLIEGEKERAKNIHLLNRQLDQIQGEKANVSIFFPLFFLSNTIFHVVYKCIM